MLRCCGAEERFAPGGTDRPAVAQILCRRALILPARLPAPGSAAAPVSAKAAATAAPEAPFGFGPRFVDRQCAAAHLVLVEFGRRLLRFLVGRHLYESEPARTAGRGIAHHSNRLDIARLAEQL